jgi:hypothetical protein
MEFCVQYFLHASKCLYFLKVQKREIYINHSLLFKYNIFCAGR